MTDNPTHAADILGVPAPQPSDPAPQGYVTLPTENSTPEEWAEFYGKLGRPETAEKYDLPVPQGLDDSFPKAMAPVMFQAGLSG